MTSTPKNPPTTEVTADTVLAFRFNALPWTLCRLRKLKKCILCSKQIAPKSHGYRPITNGYDRMNRICLACGQQHAESQ